MIDVETRTHGLVQHPQAQADTPCTQQAGEGTDQPSQISDKAFIAFQVTEPGGQSTEIRLAVFIRQFEAERLRQWLVERQQQRCEIGDVQRQLTLPDRKIDVVFEDSRQRFRRRPDADDVLDSAAV